MAVVMIGIDPHKASHTAVAIGAAQEPLGRLRVRASPARQTAWWPGPPPGPSGPGPSRGRGLGHLLAQQLVAAGERVLDVQPKLGRPGPAAGHREHQQERPQRRPVRGRRRAALGQLPRPSWPTTTPPC